jgi:hypothetical protein
MLESKQYSLSDIYAGCLDSLDNDKPQFLSMLEDHIDLEPWSRTVSKNISTAAAEGPANIR